MKHKFNKGVAAIVFVSWWWSLFVSCGKSATTISLMPWTFWLFAAYAVVMSFVVIFVSVWVWCGTKGAK